MRRIFRAIRSYYAGQETWREYWDGIIYPIRDRLRIAAFRRELAAIDREDGE